MDVVHSAASQPNNNDSSGQQIKLKIRYANNNAVSVTQLTGEQQTTPSASMLMYSSQLQQQSFNASSYLTSATNAVAKKPRGRPRKDSSSTNDSDVRLLHAIDSSNSASSHATQKQNHATPVDIVAARESHKFFQKHPVIGTAGSDTPSNKASAFPAAHDNLRTNISEALFGVMSSISAAPGTLTLPVTSRDTHSRLVHNNTAKAAGGSRISPARQHATSRVVAGNDAIGTIAAPVEVVPGLRAAVQLETSRSSASTTITNNHHQNASNRATLYPTSTSSSFGLLSSSKDTRGSTREQPSLGHAFASSVPNVLSSAVTSSDNSSALQTATRELLSMCSGNSAVQSSFHVSSSTSLTSASTSPPLRNNQFSDFSYPDVSLPAAASSKPTALLPREPQFAPFSTSVTTNPPFSNYYADIRPAMSLPFGRNNNNAASMPTKLGGPPPFGQPFPMPNEPSANSATASNSLLASFFPPMPQQGGPALFPLKQPAELPVSENDQIRKVLLYRRLKRRVLIFPELEQTVQNVVPLLEQMQLVERPVINNAASSKSKKVHPIKQGSPFKEPPLVMPPQQIGPMPIDNAKPAIVSVDAPANPPTRDVIEPVAASSHAAFNSNQQNSGGGTSNAYDSGKFAVLPLKKRLYRATVADSTDHHHHQANAGSTTYGMSATVSKESGITASNAESGAKLSKSFDADEDATSSATTTSTSHQHMDSAIDAVLRTSAGGEVKNDIKAKQTAVVASPVTDSDSTKIGKTRTKKPKQNLSTPAANLPFSSSSTTDLVLSTTDAGVGDSESKSVLSSGPRIVLKIKKHLKHASPKGEQSSLNLLNHKQQKAKFFKSKGTVSHQTSMDAGPGASTDASSARNAANDNALGSTTLSSYAQDKMRRDSSASANTGNDQHFLGCEIIFAEPTILSTTPPVMAADSATVVAAAAASTPSMTALKKAVKKVQAKPAADADLLPNSNVAKIENDILETAATTKKRGRPPKNALVEPKLTAIDAANTSNAAPKDDTPKKVNDGDIPAKKRGRPPIVKSALTTTASAAVAGIEFDSMKGDKIKSGTNTNDDSSIALDIGTVKDKTIKRSSSKRKEAGSTTDDARLDATRVEPESELVEKNAARKPRTSTAASGNSASVAAPTEPVRFFSMLPLESSDAPYHPAGLIMPNGILSSTNAAANAVGGNNDDMATEAGDREEAGNDGHSASKKRRNVAARKRTAAQQQQAIDTLESEFYPNSAAASVDRNKTVVTPQSEQNGGLLVKPLTVKIPKLVIKTPVKPTAQETNVKLDEKSQPFHIKGDVKTSLASGKRPASTVGRPKRPRLAANAVENASPAPLDASAAISISAAQRDVPSSAKLLASVPSNTTVTAKLASKQLQLIRRNSFINNYTFTDQLIYLDESLRPKKVDTPACQCQPPVADSYAEAGCDEFCTNRMVFTECSLVTCPCGDRCLNRRIQSGVYAVRKSRMELFDAVSGTSIRIANTESDAAPNRQLSNAGCNTGVRWPATEKTIEDSDVICEFAGQVMTSEMFNQRLALGQYQFAKRQFAIEMPDYGKPAGGGGTKRTGGAGNSIGTGARGLNSNNTAWPQRVLQPFKFGRTADDKRNRRKKHPPARVLLPLYNSSPPLMKSSSTTVTTSTKSSAQLVISTFEAGNESRFIRHSCIPSAKLELWLVDNQPRVVVCARDKIHPGAEITLDYGELAYARQWLCTCGTKSCRRLVGSQAVAAATAAATFISRPLPAKASSSDTQLLPWTWFRKRDHSILLDRLYPPNSGKNWHDLCVKYNIVTGRILRRHKLAIQQSAAKQRNMLLSSKSLTSSRTANGAGSSIMMTPSLLKDVLEKQIRPLAVKATVSHVPPFAAESASTVGGPPSSHASTAESPSMLDSDENVMTVEQLKPRAWEPGPASDYPEEEVIRCPCNWYVDVDDMVQCDTCQVWQHISCLALPKEQVSRDDFIYKCERCSDPARALSTPPSIAEREIPQRDEQSLLPIVRHDKQENCSFTYYLTLVADNCQNMQVRMNDYVYLTPRRDKPTHGPKYDLLDLDIMEVECLWKASTVGLDAANAAVPGEGKKMAGGRRYYRPTDLHVREGTKFYPNELVRGAIDETVTLDSIVGRCCVMDLETYQLGRPKEYPQEHIYITEYECDERRKALTKISATTKRKAAMGSGISKPPSNNNETNGADNNDEAAASALMTSNSNNKEKGQPLRKINTNNYYFQRYGEKLVPRKQPLALSRASKAKRRQHSGAAILEGSLIGGIKSGPISSSIPSVRDVVVAKCMRLEKLRQKLQLSSTKPQSKD